MVNRSTIVVLEIRTVMLTLTSRKTFTLKNVKYVSSIFKNLVSGSLLCDVEMRLDLQSGKTVLSYKKINFDNAYRTDGTYKISTTLLASVINEICISVYSSTLWHNILGHVNYIKMLNMKKLGLLSNCRVKSLENVKSLYRPRSQRSPFQMLQETQTYWT